MQPHYYEFQGKKQLIPRSKHLSIIETSILHKNTDENDNYEKGAYHDWLCHNNNVLPYYLNY